MNEDLLEAYGLDMAATGGTELVMRRLFNRIPRELLEMAQIIPTRLKVELDPAKVRVLVVHDLPNDPSLEYLKNGGWRKFHKIIFVSNWQMQLFIQMYSIPWSRCLVIQNGIEPIPPHDKPNDGLIRLIYTPTPHRGLNVLTAVFEQLSKIYDNIRLEVFSSFNLYNWPDRDKDFEEIFNILKANPKVTYHGSASNDEVRAALQRSDIFAYPSTWNETSCMCLMEAMSAGLVCIHPNLGALYETASNMTMMYQFLEDANVHAATFHAILENAINQLMSKSINMETLGIQKSYVDTFYNIDAKTSQWVAMLESLKDVDRAFESNITSFDTREAISKYMPAPKQTVSR